MQLDMHESQNSQDNQAALDMHESHKSQDAKQQLLIA